ncbi:hypothetical protein PoB_004288900 [Plakobranchus ocellatus]|uniref:Uncharacterized protein n=1 Tax=Plakobranchus ocellatus TaxID=259542 RepID=A0AAV4B8G3_9GAST|nr:hypothetical protein PoB_004288900 [Plakobranchus ocellatus]
MKIDLARLVFEPRTSDLVANCPTRQTVSIWIDFMEPILEEMTAQSHVPTIAGGAIKTEEKVWMEDNDKFEGLRLLTKCHTQQLELHAPNFTDLDLATTFYALSMINYICERYAEAKTKVAEGQNRVLQGNLLRHRIHSKLHHMNKYCDRKIYHLEKISTAQSSDSDLSLITVN